MQVEDYYHQVYCVPVTAHLQVLYSAYYSSSPHCCFFILICLVLFFFLSLFIYISFYRMP